MPVVVSLAQGGTGANSSSAALSALGAAPVAAYAQANTALTAANSVVKVSSLVYPGNDTAANNIGGQTMYINGSGFMSNSAVYINGNAAPSVSFISSGNLSFTTPNIANGIYPVYVINPADGATAVLIPGMVVSSEPSWVTGASLSDVNATDAWNISLSATGDAPITYALAAGSSLPSGISLAANGVISGTLSSPPESDTTYNFTVIATDAQNQDSSRQFSITATVGEGLPFANNVLLIHADGTNNKNNHTFLDSSNNNFTITRSNNVTQGSFSPFSQTGWSAYFDGDGDFLNAGYNSNFTFGSGNFTIECWVYTQTTGTIAGIWDDSSTNPQSWIISSANRGSTTAANINFVIDVSGSDTLLMSALQPMNKWFHLAITRSGSSWYMFMDGAQVATATSSATISAGNGGRGLNLGGYDGASQSHKWGMNGYISNFRINKGNALYTSAFTPANSALTAVSGTTLLTCQSNRFIDNSGNAYSIAVNGDVAIQPFSPFAPTSTYSTSAVGGGAIFDGSGDFLSLASNEAFNMGTGDFTLETWYYHVGGGSATYPSIFSSTDWVTGGVGLRYNNGGSGKFAFFWNGVGDPWLNASSTTPAYQWNHVALTRSGNNFTLWVNGVSAATGTNSGSINFNYNTGGPRVGWGPWDGSNGYLRGILSNLRLTKGQALYTTTFTPPTAPFTTAANTSLLLNFTNAGIFDQTTKNILETVGDAKISTSVYKYGTGSLVFDGTGDRLYKDAIKDPLSDLGIGNEPFTVEQWVYFNTVSGGFSFSIGKGGGTAGWNSSSGHQYLFGIISSGSLYVQVWNGSGLSNINVSNPFSAGQWYHYAVSYDGTTTKAFVNGSQVLSANVTYAKISNPTRFVVGDTPAYDAPFNGYIDDLRVTKGSARYTSNFTPPTSALKDR